MKCHTDLCGWNEFDSDFISRYNETADDGANEVRYRNACLSERNIWYDWLSKNCRGPPQDMPGKSKCCQNFPASNGRAIKEQADRCNSQDLRTNGRISG